MRSAEAGISESRNGITLDYICDTGANLIGEQTREKTENQQACQQQCEWGFAPRVVGISDLGPALGQRPLKHQTDCAQHINSADDRRTPNCQHGNTLKAFPRPKKDTDFPDEIRETRQPTTGEGGHY